MKIKLIPESRFGKWSLGLIFVMPILFFIGMSLVDTLYQSVPSGDTILEDTMQRPALALTMLGGMASGVLACITGFIAIIKEKERALLVYVSTTIGMLLLLFLIAEFLFPH